MFWHPKIKINAGNIFENANKQKNNTYMKIIIEKIQKTFV